MKLRKKENSRYARPGRSKTGKRTGKRGAAALLAAALILAAGFAFGTQAASAVTSYIDASPGTVKVGEDVEVTVVFTGENVGRVRATLEYDTSVLSYQGEEGDSGEVSLYMASSGGDIVYKLPFLAVGQGDAQITMTPLDVYDMDEMPASMPEPQSMTVSVTAAPEDDPHPAVGGDDPEPEDPSQTEVTEPEQPEQPVQEPDPEKPAKDTHANATVYVLGGLAVLLAVILAVMLAVRAKRRG